MAIVQVDPPQFGGASSVLVDSDAPTNEAAMREVEAWAASNGFVRTSEYYLRNVLVGGVRRFRAVCYRLTEEDRRWAEQEIREASERAQRLSPRVA